MSQPSVYMCPLPPEPPSHLPPHPTPLGGHRALSLSSLRHTAHSHWLSVLHIVICMFQLLSQVTPPSPSATISTSLFFMSASLLLPCKWTAKPQRGYVSSPKSLSANMGRQDLSLGLEVPPLITHFLVNILLPIKSRTPDLQRPSFHCVLISPCLCAQKCISSSPYKDMLYWIRSLP